MMKSRNGRPALNLVLEDPPAALLSLEAHADEQKAPAGHEEKEQAAEPQRGVPRRQDDEVDREGPRGPNTVVVAGLQEKVVPPGWYPVVADISLGNGADG